MSGDKGVTCSRPIIILLKELPSMIQTDRSFQNDQWKQPNHVTTSSCWKVTLPECSKRVNFGQNSMTKFKVRKLAMVPLCTTAVENQRL